MKEQKKSVVIIGERSAELSVELKKFFASKRLNFEIEMVRTPSVVIFLTTTRQLNRVSKKAHKLAARGCKLLVIDTSNETLETIFDKASGFLKVVL